MPSDYCSRDDLLRAVKILGFAASFLRDAGVRVYHPIGITLTEVSGLDILIRDFPIFRHELLSLNMEPVRFRKKFCRYHDDVLILHYTEGAKSSDNLSFLLETTMSGTIDSKPFCVLPLLIFDGFIPDEIVEKLSLILEFDSCHIRFSETNTDVADEKYFESLAQNICRNSDAFKKSIQDSWKDIIGLTEGKKLLLSGKAIMDFDMNLRNIPVEEKACIMENLRKSIEEALTFSESYLSKEQIVATFIRSLRYLAITNRYVMSSIEHGYKKSVDIFYDSQAYYLPLSTFDKVCSLINFSSSARVKKCLSEQGILKTEGRIRSYYTSKIYRKGFDDQRFYCLDRDKIDRETDLSLTEI